MKLIRYTVRRTITEDISFDSTFEDENLIIRRAKDQFAESSSDGLVETWGIVAAEGVEG